MAEEDVFDNTASLPDEIDQILQEFASLDERTDLYQHKFDIEKIIWGCNWSSGFSFCNRGAACPLTAHLLGLDLFEECWNKYIASAKCIMKRFNYR